MTQRRPVARRSVGVLVAALVLALCAALLFRGGSGRQTSLAASSVSERSASQPSASQPSASARSASPPNLSERLAARAVDPCARERCAECPAGMRPEAVEDECCPRCVAADQKACERGRDRYQDRYAELEAELRACSADADCMVASFSDACRASCPLPVNKQGLGSVVPKLQEAAAAQCGECAPQEFECPRRATDSARCVGGRCEFAAQAATPAPDPARAEMNSP